MRLQTPQTTSDRKTKAGASEAYGRLPLRFEANAGQTDAQVKFFSRGGGYNLFLTPTEAVLALHSKKSTNAADRQSVVRMRLTGADPTPRVEGVEELPGRSNYFIGNDPEKWRRNVASYAKVRYGNVYPGIDLIYYGNQREIEYDFVVAAGADPNAIRLTFDGMEGLRVDAQGDLVLQTADGEVRQRRPVVYQEVDGRRQEIAGRYVLAGGRDVSFELAAYDYARPLVIDPVLAYSTYLGGSGSDDAFGVAVDAEGNAYVFGDTDSLDFPTANPLQPMKTGLVNVFISKLNSEGSALVYSTYLGGNDIDAAEGGIAVDQDGNAYIAGWTTSNDFPLMNPLQSTTTGIFVDAFITKLNADGSALIYSTYFGGSNNEFPEGIAVDGEGNTYITGYTYSIDLPLANALQPVFGGTPNDGFVAKLNAGGSALVYSTYLGGSDGDDCGGIAVDVAGNAYVTGDTYSANFPIVNPFQSTPPDIFRSNAFVTKLNAAGTAILYSTFLGGSDSDGGSAIALDAAGNIYVSGGTRSTDFPTVDPSQPVPAENGALYVAKFDPTGSALIYSTFLGGGGDESVNEMAVDSEGNVYITGTTYSTDFPVLNPLQPAPVDTADFTGNAFLAEVNATGLVFSTYLGGDGDEEGAGIALDASGGIYVVGGTAAADFITTPGAIQRELGNPPDYYTMDAFICKILNVSGN